MFNVCFEKSIENSVQFKDVLPFRPFICSSISNLGGKYEQESFFIKVTDSMYIRFNQIGLFWDLVPDAVIINLQYINLLLNETDLINTAITNEETCNDNVENNKFFTALNLPYGLYIRPYIFSPTKLLRFTNGCIQVVPAINVYENICYVDPKIVVS